MPSPTFVTFYGPLGKAPAGSSIVWYGVHTFEMLERAMGRGASGVFVKKDSAGMTAVVKYPDNRRGIVELAYDAFVYGGCLRNKWTAVPFLIDMTSAYSDLLFETAKFFFDRKNSGCH